MDKITAQTAQIAQILGNFEGGGKNIFGKNIRKIISGILENINPCIWIIMDKWFNRPCKKLVKNSPF